MISAPGIGSGLDVNGIVSQLMAAERQPLAALARQEQTYNQKLSAFGQVRSTLASFQTALQDLSSGSKFQALSATASDTKVLSASASSNATPASYQLEVLQLAQQHKLASSGYAATSDVVGSGTLTIQFGTYDSGLNTFTANADKATKTITIAPANNTLAGVRDAINAANAGVSATIVNDGSATGNRLVLTSTDSGANNSLKISVTDDDTISTDMSGLSALAYNPTAAVGSGKNLSQVAAAQSAQLKIDGITVNQSTNTVKNAIDGVTLNLATTNVGVPLTLNVSRDTKTITDAVQSFVTAYNGTSGTLKNLTAFKGVGSQNGVLLGDSTARGIQVGMRNLLNTSIDSGGSLTTLSQIGVSFKSDGTLALDSTKLNTAISTNFSDITALFAKAAKATDSLVSLSASTSKTQPGAYAVNVSQLATRGVSQGTLAASLTVTAGVNDQLNLTVDGTAISVTLAAATYASASALAAEIQSKTNGAAGSAGSVVVSQSAGILSITSARYGSASQAALTGGNGLASLFGAPTPITGVDVVGTIDGTIAAGSGQILTGATGGVSEGLSLLINGGALGARGTVTFSTGYAYQINTYLSAVLANDGSLKARTTGIDSSIKSLDQRQLQLEARLAQIEKRYRAQFSALDTMLSSMNTTSSFLAQQLASLPGSSQN
ncbi:flagellar filament capping protein FliD [Thiobacillus denitrificans]|uniref:Flagellar hook-associated protein 2 n=1 Tax=Thiobacillus denitrificans TaxID=36861 RepID=A0A106BP63_THIDE|nr:flagellar filament capping protein FliD [Thiobacillus denitrificans]KVW96071.1 flagellar hook protein FliD [Thiobacillus denitrificans]